MECMRVDVSAGLGHGRQRCRSGPYDKLEPTFSIGRNYQIHTDHIYSLLHRHDVFD